MLLLLLLTTFAQAAELRPAREKIHPEMAKEFPRKETDDCKMLVRLDEDGCNAQTYEVCTDGVTQWETGYKEKTSNKCVDLRAKKNERPKDTALWEKK